MLEFSLIGLFSVFVCILPFFTYDSVPCGLYALMDGFHRLRTFCVVLFVFS